MTINEKIDSFSLLFQERKQNIQFTKEFIINYVDKLKEIIEIYKSFKEEKYKKFVLKLQTDLEEEKLLLNDLSQVENNKQIIIDNGLLPLNEIMSIINNYINLQKDNKFVIISHRKEVINFVIKIYSQINNNNNSKNR